MYIMVTIVNNNTLHTLKLPSTFILIARKAQRIYIKQLDLTIPQWIHRLKHHVAHHKQIQFLLANLKKNMYFGMQM